MKKLVYFALITSVVLITSFRTHWSVPKTYYIDSANGNDKNSGLSPKKPWQSLAKINAQSFEAGSLILLKRGSAWQGQLVLKGSGLPEKPIRISSYGNGNKPMLDGRGKVAQVLFLKDVEGWEIENLEITNAAATVGNRTGILVESLGDGLKKHFRFRNLYIHDVMGDYSFERKGKNTGGIGFIGGPATKFDDILIEHCEIGHINRVGIFTNLSNGDRAKRGNRPYTNLVIRNNIIHHCAGDGAIVRYAYRPLIAHNLAYENHNAPESLVKHGVALWCRSTDEATFEYNEVHHTRGSMDGQAFDADLDSYRTLVQYNYSHNNEGGFMLVYGSSSESIVRHNLSVDDGKKGKHIFDFPVWTSPRGSGIFHDNTIVLPSDSAVVVADEALPTARFFHNVFYQRGKAQLVVPSAGKTAEFYGNRYYGYPPNELKDSLAVLIKQHKDLPLSAPSFKKSKIYTELSPDFTQQNKAFGSSYWLPDFGNQDFWKNPLAR